MKFRDPEAGKIVRAFFNRRKYDHRMNHLLHVGYLLAQLPEGEEGFLIGADDHALLVSKMEDTLPDGTVWRMYSVQRVSHEGDIGETLFSADYNPDGLKIEHTPGPWEMELELAYAMVRDENVPKLPAGEP